MFVLFVTERESLKMPKIDWKPEILLQPNIPKPLHQVNPRSILGSSWWNKTRKAAYASTGFHCLACGVHKDKATYRQWLEGHEVYEIDYSLGRLTYLYTAPLCHFCHNFIHDGRLANLLQQGKIHHHKYAAILKHGDAVLRAANLRKLSLEDREREGRRREVLGGLAKWEDWRLELDGVLYPPKFKNYEEWLEYHTETYREPDTNSLKRFLRIDD